MNLHLHFGVHYTDANAVVHSVRSNPEFLKQQGVYFPPPRFLRRTVRDYLAKLDGMPPIESEQTEVMDNLVSSEVQSWANNLVFAEESWCGALNESFEHDMLCSNASEHLLELVELFGGQNISLSLALRNPAVYLNSAYHTPKFQKATGGFIGRVSPEEIRWSPMIKALRACAPDLPLTLWCVEDQLLIWPKILAALKVPDLDLGRDEALAPFEGKIAPEGLTLLQKFLQKNEKLSPLQFEKTALAFLDKYALEDAFDETVDLPGWDASTVELVSANYEEDLMDFSAQEGITVLMPQTFSDEDA